MSADTTMLPDTVYTPFYCEENVYLLCQALEGEDVAAVFISNHTKTVALWNQKLGKDPLSPVVWDYHCVLIRRCLDQYFIYDFDTRLPFPCLLKEYLQYTFWKEDTIPQSFHSLFRIVPGLTYLQYFASDRSHMLDSEHQYRSPPPSYAPLRGSKATVANNLMESFVDMGSSAETFGSVKELGEMRNYRM